MVIQSQTVIKKWERKQLLQRYYNVKQSASGITKCDKSLLQSVEDKSASGIRKCGRLLLQSASGITKSDRLYYKVHQVLQSTYNYYKVRHHTVWQRKKRKIFRWCDSKRSYTLRANIVFVWLCLNLCQLEWLKKSVKSMSMSSHKVKFLNFLNDSAWCCWKSSLFHSGVCWMNERKLNEFVLK